MEVCFVNVFDWLQLMFYNVLIDGYMWQQYGIVKDQVVECNKIIVDGVFELWEYVECFFEEVVVDGIFDVQLGLWWVILVVWEFYYGLVICCVCCFCGDVVCFDDMLVF